MSVDDHGLEALRKAALQLTPGNKGEYKLRVILFDADGNPLDPVSVNIQAPTGPFLVTPFIVSDVAANPLVAPLTGRVSLSIRNISAVDPIHLGPTAGVVTDVTVPLGGWAIAPLEDLNFDLDASEVFYLIAATGKLVQIQILEIAST